MSLAAAAEAPFDVQPQALLQRAEELLRDRDLAAALVVFDRAEANGAEPDRCCAGRWNAHTCQLAISASAWHESDVIRWAGVRTIRIASGRVKTSRASA